MKCQSVMNYRKFLRAPTIDKRIRGDLTLDPKHTEKNIMSFARSSASTVNATASGFKYGFTCDWGDAAAILCDSVIDTVLQLPHLQQFNCVHPKWGELEVILTCVSDSAVMTNFDLSTLETLKQTIPIVGEIQCRRALPANSSPLRLASSG